MTPARAFFGESEIFRCYPHLIMRRRFLHILALTSLAGAACLAPQEPARPSYDHSAAPDVAMQIHIDENCEIIPGSALALTSGKKKPFRDGAVCSLEGISNSEHDEERISGNQLLRWHVRIDEQTFVLQNVSDAHVVFFVERSVPKGWVVDSDPQPNRYVGSIAVFPVHAQPGETVRLHVGIRRMIPLKPRPL
jgi:hypothetical protein